MLFVGILKKLIFSFRYKRKMRLCLSYFDPMDIYISGLENIEIMNNVYIAKGGWIASLGGRILIEDNASIGRYSHIISTKNIRVGKNALIAEKVYISDNLHGYENIDVPIKDQILKQLNEVYIGEGSWIGENVCIIGASIGKNSVVGANSVVTHDIPDFCVAVGSPASVIKRYDFNDKKWIKVS